MACIKTYESHSNKTLVKPDVHTFHTADYNALSSVSKLDFASPRTAEPHIVAFPRKSRTIQAPCTCLVVISNNTSKLHLKEPTEGLCDKNIFVAPESKGCENKDPWF